MSANQADADVDMDVDGRDGEAISPAVDLKALTKYYGKHRGIEGVDLVVDRGEIFGFLGPNGAGKTTTIRTMLDFIRRTSGECRVLGRDSRKRSLDIKRRTGYLPGEYGLYESLTVEAFLLFMLDLRGARDKEPRMRELARYFELELGRRIGELSRGNRQKVGLVQAFMHDPELVILDEPTSGLDPLMQQRFYSLARQERASGRTIFMSSHLLSEVEAVCDRVAIIREGRIVLLESLKSLRSRFGKELKVTFGSDVAMEALALPGVEDIAQEGRSYTMTIRGEIDEVVKALARHPVVSMTVETYHLEQLFNDLFGDKEETERRAAAIMTNGGGAR